MCGKEDILQLNYTMKGMSMQAIAYSKPKILAIFPTFNLTDAARICLRLACG
jgi:hypothetical protein